MTERDRTHVWSGETPSGDHVEIVDVEGPWLPHEATPHQTRQVWIAEKGYMHQRIDLRAGKTLPAEGTRMLVHEQRFISPDEYERLLLNHQRLSANYEKLRAQVVSIQAFLGHSEFDDMRVALRDVLADDYRDHRRCTSEKCAWCRAHATLEK